MARVVEDIKPYKRADLFLKSEEVIPAKRNNDERLLTLLSELVAAMKQRQPVEVTNQVNVPKASSMITVEAPAVTVEVWHKVKFKIIRDSRGFIETVDAVRIE